ncbi:MAG TPA: sigma-54 dependent transcriptional regulator [Acidobacteriota bacterium]|nr:sigma-54 dependent transcriptional regulator [Acidobacteriota bacterium]
MRGRVLVVDDDHSMCDALKDDLTRRDFSTQTRTSATAALEALEMAEFDVVVTDLNMNGMNGIEFCEHTQANRPDIPVIVITGFGSFDSAVAAIRAGAYDFITKPFDVETLVLALDRAVQHRTLRDEVKRLRETVSTLRPPSDIIGESHAMKKLFGFLHQVAGAEVTVLITGETGTGKELAARLLHRLSCRCNGPFVALDAAAVPETLLESQLFGHVRGAFTDAKTDHRGLFMEASGGTLFLDEIGNLPQALQPKLLRAIQERRVRPLGGNTEIPFDVRLVTATNSDIERAVEEGRFRSDLYFRLNVVHVEVPPLRERGNDILLLAQHFVSECTARMNKPVRGLTPSAAGKLLSYGWPGNIRELQNCIERAVALTGFDELTVEDLPERVRDHKPSHLVFATDDPGRFTTLEDLERRYILRVLSAVGGNKVTAARILGVDRKTLYRKLDRWAEGGDRRFSQD